MLGLVFDVRKRYSMCVCGTCVSIDFFTLVHRKMCRDFHKLLLQKLLNIVYQRLVVYRVEQLKFFYARDNRYRNKKLLSNRKFMIIRLLVYRRRRQYIIHRII